MPAWVGPTVAISLVVIATAMLVMGGVALAIGLGIRKARRDVTAKLAVFSADAKKAATRLRIEMDGFADLSGETRKKLRSAVDRVEERLVDLDTLVEVLTEEAQETALDVAALVRTVRRPASIFSVARSALRGRRRRR